MVGAGRSGGFSPGLEGAVGYRGCLEYIGVHERHHRVELGAGSRLEGRWVWGAGSGVWGAGSRVQG